MFRNQFINQTQEPSSIKWELLSALGDKTREAAEAEHQCSPSKRLLAALLVVSAALPSCRVSLNEKA